MFSFGLVKQRKGLEVERLLGRMLNQTALDQVRGTIAFDCRMEGRPHVVRPVMVAPESEGRPDTSQVQFGLTTDMSMRGCAAYFGTAIASETVYVGLHFDDEAKIFRATVRCRADAGGGFQRVGLEFIEMADPAALGISILQSLGDELR